LQGRNHSPDQSRQRLLGSPSEHLKKIVVAEGFASHIQQKTNEIPYPLRILPYPDLIGNRVSYRAGEEFQNILNLSGASDLVSTELWLGKKVSPWIILYVIPHWIFHSNRDFEMDRFCMNSMKGLDNPGLGSLIFLLLANLLYWNFK